MLELPLVVLGGLLGSAHCVGMCGPLAIMIGLPGGNWHQKIYRQAVYSGGRIFTYSVMGGMAGFGGWRLVRAFPQLAHLPAWLSLAAGLLLIYQGLRTAGVFPKRPVAGSRGDCLAAVAFRRLLAARTCGEVFLAGMVTGLLPCGLTYAFLTMAASTTHFFPGVLIMASFGIGTSPVMMATGIGGSWLAGESRLRMLRVAAWCVVLAGILCVARGLGGMPSAAEASKPFCPFCVEPSPSFGKAGPENRLPRAAADSRVGRFPLAARF